MGDVNTSVDKQAMKLASDCQQMKKQEDRKPLHMIRKNMRTPEEMAKLIDDDADLSKSKAGSWKQLPAYLKWPIIETYLRSKNITEIGEIKTAFRGGGVSDVEFNTKTKVVLSITCNGKKI